MRKQHLYWLLAIILLVIFAILPYAQIETVQSLYKATSLGFTPVVSTLETVYTFPLLILLIVCIALPVLCLFSGKRRMLQFRVTVLNVLLHLGFIALMLFYAFSVKKGMAEGSILSFRLVSLLPLLSLFCCFFAARNTWKDIVYLRRMDRLR